MSRIFTIFFAAPAPASTAGAGPVPPEICVSSGSSRSPASTPTQASADHIRETALSRNQKAAIAPIP